MPVRRLLRAAVCVSRLLLFVAVCAPVSGRAQGTISAASTPLSLPSGVAYDASGNLYVAETGAHRVWCLRRNGEMQMLAGTGVQGFSGDGGPATSAQVDSPTGVAVDGGGNVYLADSHNRRIRKVDAASGVITTIAGGGTGGLGDGGPAMRASLVLPVAVAVDATGNVWIADAGDHRVRRIDGASAVIQTVAGTGVEGNSGDGGMAVSAVLDTPSGVAVALSGDVYVADEHNRTVRRIDAATGRISTVVSSGGAAGQSASAARLLLPRGISLDAAGRLYIADAGSGRLLQADVGTGAVTAAVGSGVEGFAGDGGDPLAAALDGAWGTAISPGGNLSFADAKNGRVRQVSGGVVQTVAGLGAGSGGGAVSAAALVLSSGGTMVYGTASVTGQLTTSGSASGGMTLMEGALVIGHSTPVLNVATFDLAGLAAGQHTLTASYSGDSTHAAAVAAALTVTIAPASLQVRANAASVGFGAILPSLTGSVVGLLPQDVSQTHVTFSTTATQGSAVGSYPITVGVSGSAATNYVVSATPAVLTVVKAASVATIVGSTAASGTSDFAVSMVIRSTTTGQPTGYVTLLDGQTPVGAGRVAVDGSCTLDTGTLAVGSHTLTIFYSGDGNFLASTSTPAVVDSTLR